MLFVPGSSVGRIFFTRPVLIDVEPTPITPNDSMSDMWYSSFAPPPTMWRKSALIVDSNSGASSKRFLTSSRRCRTATSLWRSLRRRSADAERSDAPIARSPTAARSRVLCFFMGGRSSAEGRVLERGRQPEADADLEHHVVDQRAVGVALRFVG